MMSIAFTGTCFRAEAFSSSLGFERTLNHPAWRGRLVGCYSYRRASIGRSRAARLAG